MKYQLKLNDPEFLPQYGCSIDLELVKGTVLLLTGENGIGKSSLAKRFSMLYPDTISYIEQKDLDHFYNRTLSQLKKVFLEARRESLSESIFLELWERFNLHKKETRKLSELSGGEGQALKLCLGLSSNKELYLLDEPSQYLDKSNKDLLDAYLNSILMQKKTIVLIEHDYSWGSFPVRKVNLVVKDKMLGVE